MTRNDVTRYRKVLLEKQAELSTGFSVDEIAVERNADPTDELQCAAERELILRRLAWQAMTLRAVAAALRRINDGSYGICVECEGAISPKRLAASPWTPVCIRCQETADREERPRIRFKAA